MSNVEELLKNCHLTQDKIENNIEIKNTDGINYLKEIENNSIDLVLTDPPYIISRESGMNTFYKNVKHLYDMIDFSNWIFWNQTGGIYEYTKDMKLAFYPDGTHPTSASHSHYVDCFLIPKLKTLGIV